MLLIAEIASREFAAGLVTGVAFCALMVFVCVLGLTYIDKQ